MLLRKRSFALIVLLLTITVVSLTVRSQSSNNQPNSPHVIELETADRIEAPDSPSSDMVLPDIKEETKTPDEVITEPKPEPPKSSTCYIGGCSGQLCTDSPDIASTCEWRESYACYQNTTCERQASGQCGWTETPELKACLMNADLKTDIQVW